MVLPRCLYPATEFISDVGHGLEDAIRFRLFPGSVSRAFLLILFTVAVNDEGRFLLCLRGCAGPFRWGSCQLSGGRACSHSAWCKTSCRTLASFLWLFLGHHDGIFHAFWPFEVRGAHRVSWVAVAKTFLLVIRLE